MSDGALITEKANYNARAGEVIAGNLARGAAGQFTSAGQAAGKKAPPKQSLGAKRAAANAKLQQRLAARRAAAAKKASAKAKPKGGKGAKPAAKPKGSIDAAKRRAEVAARQQARAAEAVKRKAERLAEQAKRATAQEAKKVQREQDRAAATAKREAERAKRLALAEQRRAAKTASGGGGKGAKAPKPKADPKPANRATVQAATLDKATFDALQSLVSGQQPAAGAAVDALLATGLAERDTAGTLRISQAGRAYTNAADRGDVGRANDAMSRARDRVAERTKPRPPGRDAPIKGAQTTKEYTPDRVVDAGHTGVMVYLPLADDVTAAIAAMDGVTEPAEGMHITLAHLGKTTETHLATNKDRLIGFVKDWAAAQAAPLTGVINGVGRFMTVEDGDTNAVYVSPDLAKLPAFRQSLIEWLHTSGFDVASAHGYTPHITVAYVPLDAPTPDLRPADIALTIDTVCLAWGDEQFDLPLGQPAVKETSLAVYKQANGRYRWIGVSSTAYQDRDGQYVSLKALQDDVARADLDGYYGPLRFWHLPGVDLGSTDYNAVVGRSLVESGEMYDDGVGEALATTKEHWQMSLGFLHGRNQPQGDTYTAIRRFERSILPASAASNPFTNLLVYKGTDMSATTQEKIAKLKELVPDNALLEKLLAGIEATEKEADAAGVRFKMTEVAAEGPDVEEKAAGDGSADAGADSAEGEMDMAAEEDAAAESILTDIEINAIADAVLAKLTPLLSAATTKAATQPDVIDQFLGELSAVQKEARASVAAADKVAADAAKANADRQAEIVTLKQRLAALEGDQPRAAGYRATADAETVTTKGHKGPMDADAYEAAVNAELMAGADFLLSQRA